MDDWRIIIYILNIDMQVVMLTAELSLRKKNDINFYFGDSFDQFLHLLYIFFAWW